MPGQRSTVSAHPERAEIEKQLRAGVASQKVARDHDLSRQSMDRFRIKLLAGPAGNGDDGREEMLKQVRGLYNQVTDLVRSAKEANAPRAFLAATAEARRCLNLLSTIIGLLNESPPPPVAVVVNVKKLQAVILGALSGFPKARQAVAKALIEHDASEAGGDA